MPGTLWLQWHCEWRGSFVRLSGALPSPSARSEVVRVLITLQGSLRMSVLLPRTEKW